MSVTLEQLQMTEYRALCKLDDICRENGLKVVLHFGTLLGAIRHNGFIPWDDDIDVFMSLREFNKLKKILKKRGGEIDGYALYDFSNDPEIPICTPKFRYKNSVMHEEAFDGINLVNEGVWVDVMPCCNCAKSAGTKNIQLKLTNLMRKLHAKYLYRQKIAKGRTDLKKERTYKLCKVLTDTERRLLIKLLQQFISFLGSKNSSECICFGCREEKFRVFERRFLEETTTHVFVDRDFYVPADYGNCLIVGFGKDYMTPKQFGSHVNLENVVIG